MNRHPLRTTLAENERLIAGMRRTVTRVIPVLQLAGTVSVVFAILAYAPHTPASGLVLILPVLIVVFGLGAFSAVRLWRDDESGRRYAMLHQALLIPKLSVSGLIVYDIQDIFHINLLIWTAENVIGTRFDVGFLFGQLWLVFLAETDGSAVGVNLIPLAAFLVLRYWPRLRDRNEALKYQVFG